MQDTPDEGDDSDSDEGDLTGSDEDDRDEDAEIETFFQVITVEWIVATFYANALTFFP